MLGKLTKYEFKATARTILPLYAAVIVVAVITKLMFTFNAQNFAYGIPSALSVTMYVMLIAAMFVMTLLVLIQRFYKNLMKDEGYLMFTLPVNSGSHIFAKLIVSFVWTVLSVIVALISVFVLAYSKELIPQIREFFGTASAQIKAMGIEADAVLIFTEIIVYALSALIMSILMIYCSISIGQLFNRHKIAGSFAAYIGLYALIQIVNSILLVILSGSVDVIVTTPEDGLAFAKTLFLCITIIDIVWAAAYFTVSRYLLKNKLNLE